MPVEDMETIDCATHWCLWPAGDTEGTTLEGVLGGMVTPRLEHPKRAFSYLSLITAVLVRRVWSRRDEGAFDTSSGTADCLVYTEAVWTSAGSAPVRVGPG